MFLSTPLADNLLILQHGFDTFLSRLEIAEFEPEIVRGRMTTRDARNKVRSIAT